MSAAGSRHTLRRSGSLKKSSFAFGWFGRGAFLAGVCLILWVQASVASGGTAASLRTPPPKPEVAPVISGSYLSDVDGDRIDDELERRLDRSAAGKLRSASADARRDTIGVELIFCEPVAQEHIDTFLALGGQIAYMYQAVSYGWNGRIAADDVRLLPSVMGPTLVHVTGIPKIQFYMDLASQSGRVRPVWKPGFAGSVSGFGGDPNTTIAFIDSGVDGRHCDLTGRCVYWNDLSSANEPYPVDTLGHGSQVAGVAVGTGEAAGAEDVVLKYTQADEFSFWWHMTDPITIRPRFVNLTSVAYWDGESAWLDHVYWAKGAVVYDYDFVNEFAWGTSPLSLTNAFYTSDSACYATMLIEPFGGTPLDSVVIVNSISKYPAVGDGFNTFRGVAPDCKWAAVALSYDSSSEFENSLAAAFDDLVLHRREKNIKIINISGGLGDDDGLPMKSLSLRDKVTSAVKSGVVVVAAAGNSAEADSEAERMMADPARTGLAITVGASNDNNTLTGYSTCGFASPDSYAGEDFKPDLIAPGGSELYSAVMSVDSGSCDGSAGPDREPNDYANSIGTSFSSPFAAGCAALVIEAMERGGVEWDFSSDRHPRFVKMVLCATASETNANRESRSLNPTLQRSSAGPDGFPSGKDCYEGYGLVNADAAVEAVSSTYFAGSSVGEELGKEAGDRRVWARNMPLTAGCDVTLSLQNPSHGDFDLYLYSTTPSDMGTPTVLASSTKAQTGGEESVSYVSDQDMTVLLVVKRVSGYGTFELSSVQAGPPVAQDISVTAGMNSPLTVSLGAADDGFPDPPGKLTYTVVSLPQHGQLAGTEGGAPIGHVPTTLADGVNEVVYHPDPDWLGEDSFTFRANDGGTPPFGGTSNTATVSIRVVNEVTVVCQVAAGADDAHALRWSTVQMLSDPALEVGQYVAGMRFRSVNIPQGANILKTTLKIRSYSSGLGARVTISIRAEATDNAGEFDSSHRVNNVTTTSASRSWDLGTAMWKSNTWYESPDISGVIQEVVDRSGWQADNGIVIICGIDNEAVSNRKLWSYDGDPANAAQLQITYRP